MNFIPISESEKNFKNITNKIIFSSISVMNQSLNVPFVNERPKRPNSSTQVFSLVADKDPFSKPFRLVQHLKRDNWLSHAFAISPLQAEKRILHSSSRYPREIPALGSLGKGLCAGEEKKKPRDSRVRQPRLSAYCFKLA